MKIVHKKHLKTSLLSMIILLIVVLSGYLAYSGFQIYRSDMIGRYQQYAGDGITFLASQIDGDDLEQCINSGQKSETYKSLQLLMDDFKETHDLLYVYIIKPLKNDPPDNMMDVIAATTAYEREYEADELTNLGNLTGDLYPADVAANYIKRMDRNPEVTYFRNDTDFGDIYTAIRPIFNQKGDPIAVLCADVEINAINSAASKYGFGAGIAMLVFLTATLLIVNFWIKRRISEPLHKLQKSAGEFEDKCRRRAEPSELIMKNPEIHTDDEIEALSDSIISMVEDVQDYAKDLLEKDREISKKEGEISSMKEYVSRLDTLAYQDSLTGAGNKAAYEKAVQQLNRNIENGSVDFAIVMCDMNYLKKINDNFGHDKGNLYIQNMYNLLNSCFKESPIFRIGGDEFAVIVQDEELKHCDELVETLKAQMQKIAQDEGLEPWMKISTAVGSAYYEPGDTVNRVFQKADKAMYEEKRKMHAQR